MKEKLTHNIMDVIKETKPTSRFAFLARNYAFWVGAILSIAVGSLTIAVMIFVFTSQTWELIEHTGGILKSLIYILPYFWLVVFILFVILTWYAVRHVDGGYRLALPIIVAVYFVVSILLGIGLYSIGIGDRVERGFVEHAPFYQRMVEPRQRMWQDPEEGRLIGIIHDLREEGIMVLDIEDEEWLVDVTEMHPDEIPFGLRIDMPIHVLGDIIDTQVFKAEIIRIPQMPMHRPTHVKKLKGIKIIEMKEMR